MKTKAERNNLDSVFGGPRLISNGVKKILRYLRERAQNVLFAAFAPLADIPPQSEKLSALYNTDANLATYINSMFKIAISVGAIIAVIRLGIAGFKYMGGDMWHTKEKAKEDIRDVFFGLLLLLSIWIILAQINPNILNLNIVFPKTPEITSPYSKSTVSVVEQGALEKILRNETEKRNILAAAHIGINKSACTQVFQPNCTNVGLLGDKAISGLAKLKSDCQRAYGNCSVIVNGGTEWFAHSQSTLHGPGNSVVDLDRNGVLDEYIKKNGQYSYSDTFIKGKRTDVYALNGAKYYSEDNAHWHVVF